MQSLFDDVVGAAEGLVVLLASPASSFNTGAAHVIAGGSLVMA